MKKREIDKEIKKALKGTPAIDNSVVMVAASLGLINSRQARHFLTRHQSCVNITFHTTPEGDWAGIAIAGHNSQIRMEIKDGKFQ